jgi:hypothetical protein
MSWRACKRVWDEFPPGGALKLVLLALADYGNDEGERIYPSMQGLAVKVGMSEAQARRYVGKLVKVGAIECVANFYGGRPGMTRHYRINFDRLTGCEHATRRGGVIASREARDGLQSCAQTGCEDARDGLHIRTETGCRTATQPLSEPKVNRLKNRERAIASPLALDVCPSCDDIAWTKSEMQSRDAVVADFDTWHRDVIQKWSLHVEGEKRTDWPKQYRIWMLREFGYLTSRRPGSGKSKATRDRHSFEGMDYGKTGAV